MTLTRKPEHADFWQSVQPKRITIFTGHFGSGKTELALNFAAGIQRDKAQLPQSRPVTLIDLDLVNPYFRSQEAKLVIEAQGIKAVVPPETMYGSDLPVLVTEAFEAFVDPNRQLVVDVGGDDQGALALGQFRQWLTEGEYDFWLVVNPYRPFNEDVAGIKQSRERVEAASRLRLTGLISNPNLGRETTAEVIAEGHQIVAAAAREMGLPLKFLAVSENLTDALNLETVAGQNQLEPLPVLPIKIFVYPDWLNE